MIMTNSEASEPRQCSAGSHVFEAPVERLQLLAGELGLSLQLLQALGLVPDGGQLQVAVAAVYGRKRATEDRRRGAESETERDGGKG